MSFINYRCGHKPTWRPSRRHAKKAHTCAGTVSIWTAKPYFFAPNRRLKLSNTCLHASWNDVFFFIESYVVFMPRMVWWTEDFMCFEQMTHTSSVTMYLEFRFFFVRRCDKNNLKPRDDKCNCVGKKMAALFNQLIQARRLHCLLNPANSLWI